MLCPVRMKRHGPDSLNSWIVTAGLTFLSMVLYSVVRLSGVLFVASMERFGVDRKSAALPYILTDFIQAISSPLTGFLASKFGARLVMVLGCLVSGVGIACCFFAQTIVDVTVFWGVVFGVGFGLSVPLLALVVTQHFAEKRAIAMGVVYSGGYAGYSALPTIVENAIKHYGLSGTFLLISGLMLNCIPVALLLRKPKFSTTDKVRSRDAGPSINDACDEENSKGVVNYGFEPERNGKNPDATKRSGIMDDVDEKGTVVADFGFELESRMNAPKSSGRNNGTSESKDVDDFGSELERNGLFNDTKRSEVYSGIQKATDCQDDTGHSDPFAPSSPGHDQNHPQHIIPIVEHSHQLKKRSAQPLKAFKVFLEPVYIVLLFAEAVFEGSFIAFVTILVDFSLDVGLNLSDTKFVLLAFSLSSNVGLVSFGWVTDDGHLSLTAFSGLLLVLRSATCAFVAFSWSMPALLVAVALHGLCEAPLSNLFPLIIAEYYAPEVHGVAISCRLFLCAPVYLVTPTLIGYFRDGLGSYLYLFLGISGCSLVSGVLCYWIPQLSKCRCGRAESSILRKQQLHEM